MIASLTLDSPEERSNDIVALIERVAIAAFERAVAAAFEPLVFKAT
jgi:hypothetical protein